MDDHTALAIRPGRGLVPDGAGHGGQDFVGLAVAVQVPKVAALVVPVFLDEEPLPFPAGRTRIAQPFGLLAEPGAGGHVEPAVAVDIEGRIHEIPAVAFAFFVDLALDFAYLHGAEIRREINVRQRDDVGLAVVIEIAHIAGLAPVCADAVHLEGNDVLCGRNRCADRDE